MTAQRGWLQSGVRRLVQPLLEDHPTLGNKRFTGLPNKIVPAL